MLKPSRVVTVVPTIPEPLRALSELAHNLRWTWDPRTADLFRRLDPARWAATNHNPVLLLRTTDQARLDDAARDSGYRRELAGVAAELAAYLDGEPVPGPRLAYFSAEFGLSESLPIYSGGLGILAGDHLKSASDLSLPMTGVGLFYRYGYFSQRFGPDGWQQELYPPNVPASLPVRVAMGLDGAPLRVELQFPGRVLHARVWHVQVGRVPLYLLDTDVEENSPADREITHHLYGGDRDMRIRQELLLGFGGIQVLDALDRRPDVCHLNEGHSAFLSLERARQLIVEHGLTFDEARVVAGAGMLFTTHTPVAAGHDSFDSGMIDYYLGDYYRALGLTRNEFMALGRMNATDEAEPFSLTVLALRFAGHSNGVSRLHAHLSRQLWGGVWPGLREDEVPIDGVTNGVHLRSWIAPTLTDLYEEAPAPPGIEIQEERTGLDVITDRELWDRHERLRGGLVHFVRARLSSQLARRGAGPTEVGRAVEALDPAILTIGFARRFAEYKRAALLLRDRDRLLRMVSSVDRPVQFIFAGKAHPNDNGGKELIRQLFHLMQDPAVRGRVVLLEEYDIGVARRMVQGVDVWLNTPRRPMEASGTSGMKAVANGALAVSTLDGWWDEAYHPGVGWAIGDRRAYDDHDYQDQLEFLSLYEILENEVIPLFYDRDAAGLPKGWVSRMRASMKAHPTLFNTDRMVGQYNEKFYQRAGGVISRLAEDGYSQARDLTAWMAEIERLWPTVQVGEVRGLPSEIPSGTSFDIEVDVTLGEIDPEHVAVTLIHGVLDADGHLHHPSAMPLGPVGKGAAGVYCFGARGVRDDRSGDHGYAIRVMPRHELLDRPSRLGLVHWSD
ncbi:MAG: alpha-glucan family phosphorylase [Chloroflexota bacterium]